MKVRGVYSSVTHIWKLARSERALLAGGLVFTLVASGLGLIYPRFLGRIVDGSVSQGINTNLKDSIVSLLAVVATQSVFVYLRSYYVNLAGERVVLNLRTRIFGQILRLPMPFFSQRQSGEIQSRLNEDVGKIHGLLSFELGLLLQSVLTIIGALAMLCSLSLRMTLAVLAIVPPLMVMAIWFLRKVRALGMAAQDEFASASGFLQERLSCIDTVKSLCAEKASEKGYRNLLTRSFDSSRRRMKAQSLYMALSTFLAFSALCGLLWVASGKLGTNNPLSVGTLSEFIAYSVLLGTSVASLAGLSGRLSHVLGSTDRVIEFLERKTEYYEETELAWDDNCDLAISVSSVDFGYYEDEKLILRKLSIDAASGDHLALVGESGCGKTTLSRLLLGFWSPSSGTIRLNGRDIENLPVDWLRRQIAIVQQEPVLFSGTILENIRMGADSASEADIKHAARLASASDFIEKLPGQYSAEVGERGRNLSAGQRQRIAIARAVLRNPKILILDEATSALDGENERSVQDAISELSRGRTTLTIAHRLSAVKDARRIAVVKDGEIVEQGRHNDLIQKTGVYTNLFAGQCAPSVSTIQ